MFQDIYLTISSTVFLMLHVLIFYICLVKYRKLNNPFFLWFAIAEAVRIFLATESLAWSTVLLQSTQIGISYLRYRPYANVPLLIAPLAFFVVALIVYKEKAERSRSKEQVEVLHD